MNRYIVFDTETTGFDPLSGDKIIEIGAVEMIDNKRTGRTYHQYVNPERSIPKDVVEITKITDNDVANKPIFKEIAQDFLNFINYNPNHCENTFLVAHNASFDIKFLNHELKSAGFENLDKYEFIDTLELARKKFPNQKATLDILCEKFGISLEERRKDGHGALLDSQILVDVFIKLTEGKNNFTEKDENIDFIGIKKRDNILKSRKFEVSNEEIDVYNKFLEDNKLLFILLIALCIEIF